MRQAFEFFLVRIGFKLSHGSHIYLLFFSLLLFKQEQTLTEVIEVLCVLDVIWLPM